MTEQEFTPVQEAPPIARVLAAGAGLNGGSTQATQIEQARAVAEVAGAIQAARACPRSTSLAVHELSESCKRRSFAMRTFWRYRRGKEMLTGPTIDFAEEAMRCWQNMQSGTAELVRRASESEVMAYAWDVQMNTRRVVTTVVPHSGYTDNEPEPGQERRRLVTLRDVRENNQSVGSRIEREMILSVLPEWYVQDALDLCRRTIAGEGDGRPLPQQRAAAVEAFERFGVRPEWLIAKVGVEVDHWNPMDLANLAVIIKSLSVGESTVEAEFGEFREAAAGTLTSERIRGRGREPEPDGEGADEAPAATVPAPGRGEREPDTGAEHPEDPPAPATPERQAVIREFMAVMGNCGTSGDEACLVVAARLAGVTPVPGSLSRFTVEQLAQAVDTLREWRREGGEEQVQERVLALLPEDGDPVWDEVSTARRQHQDSKPSKTTTRRRKAADKEEATGE